MTKISIILSSYKKICTKNKQLQHYSVPSLKSNIKEKASELCSTAHWFLGYDSWVWEQPFGILIPFLPIGSLLQIIRLLFFHLGER